MARYRRALPSGLTRNHDKSHSVFHRPRKGDGCRSTGHPASAVLHPGSSNDSKPHRALRALLAKHRADAARDAPRDRLADGPRAENGRERLRRQHRHVHACCAFRNDCDQLVVITNDSDLAEPIRIINKELKMPVGVFNPHTQDTANRKHQLSGRPGTVPKAKPSVELRKFARFVREVRSDGPQSHVALSQFPPQLQDAQGRVLKKPAGW